MSEASLWRYFQELSQALELASRGDDSLPFVKGNFLVTALSGDVELTISDISEEDAVLIAAELNDMGVKALISGSVICPNCARRVPQQDYCTSCRTKLAS